MRISADRIQRWAGQQSAPGELPRLIRRLAHATTILQSATMPASEAVTLPGWDGQTRSDTGSAWVPCGAARWEWSCETNIRRKATEDFEKRTDKTPAEQRASSTFVFVSARRWPGKNAWIAEDGRASEWKEVRAYDATTLEEWLEEAPGVALAFAEELGDAGPGVETLARYWSTWSRSAAPAITMEACKEGRADIADRLAAAIKDRVERRMTAPVSIRADTAEEASAFACGAVQSLPEIALQSLVVTTPDGWRYVEKHEGLTVAIAAAPELAERVPQHDGLVVVIPYGASDMARHFRGVSGDTDTDAAEIVLDRPMCHDFAKALQKLGIDESVADRLAAQVGRSWSIYRRRRAVNPAVRLPRWLDSEAGWVLSTMCLAGGWKSDRPRDREVIARIAGHPYEAVEKALLSLSRVDDAPVIRIGTVWKAKAPLELLDLFAERITSDEIDRYLAETLAILSAPDPALELEPKNRGVAEIYGKTRAQSGLLIESLAESLIKLAVRGADMQGLASLHLPNRVGRLVRDLLQDADATRWLSLAGLLRPLAEAAPTEFLSSVERSLAKADRPIAALFATSEDDDYFTRSYHVELLWALELLAWAPSRFVRVVRILAQLAKLPLPERLGNRPSESLLGLFRTWLPQTAAPIEQRIEVLNWLVSSEAEVGFKITDKLVYPHSDMGSHGARPRWRSDDAGHGRAIPHKDRVAMVIAAADHQIELARGNVERLCRLIDKLEAFDELRIDRVLNVVAEFRGEAGDADRERLWGALRKRINWHQQRRERRSEKLPPYHARMVKLYDEIAPVDVVVRHRWLFRDGWPEPPIRRWRADVHQRTKAAEAERQKALKEILATEGLPGIERLAAAAPGYGFVGQVLAKSGAKLSHVRAWLLERIVNATPGDHVHDLMFGLFRALPGTDSIALIRDVCHCLRASGDDMERIAAVLVAGPVQRPTWELAAEFGSDIEAVYWKRCNPNMWVRAGDEDFEFVARKLCAAGRPSMALTIGHLAVKKIDGQLLLEVIEQFSYGNDLEGPRLSSWNIREAIDHLEATPTVDRHRVALVEFRLFEALGLEGGRHAKSLYAEITSNPRVFADFICMVYKPHTRTEETEISEKQRALATHAWRILNDCETLPGTAHDGTFDPEAFKKFITEAQRLCAEADRLASCDSVLGQILSHAPADRDEVWPFGPARDVLDHADHEHMREGFEVGTHNNRGVVTKSYAEGGGQERRLANRYRRHAAALHNSHPLVAAMLEKIADGYEQDGQREDDRAKMMMERG